MSDLGRRIPTDWRHVERYAMSALIPQLGIPPETEKSLGLPWWWESHDQGQEGACVGFGCSAMMSITNHMQRKAETGKSVTYRYDSRWLYVQAQLVDEWGDTPPAEGTSVRAGCEILRTVGHRRVQRSKTSDSLLEHGIETYRWARTIDEVRAAIYANLAVAIGINWYSNFDYPILTGGEFWIGQGELGSVRGGHCVCLYRMSDRRQAFRIMNSWGPEYPPVWIPYGALERLLSESGEVAVITDR